MAGACALFAWGRDGSRMHYEKKAGWWKQCYALVKVLLGNHSAKLFRNGLRKMTKSSRCCLGLQIPKISIQLSIYGLCWTNKSDGGPPHNVQDLKYLLLMSWCHRSQNNIQRSCGVYASMHQSCFGSTGPTLC